MKILPHLQAKSIMSSTYYNFSFTWCKKKKPNIKKHKFIFNEPHKGLTISLKSRINVLSISISAWTRALKTQLNIGHQLILCIFGSKQTTPFIFTFTLFEETTKSMSIVKSSLKKVTTKFGPARHVTTKRHFDIHGHKCL